MRSALSEFKINVFSDALLPDIQNPGVIKHPGVCVGFAAGNNKLNTVKILFEIHSFKQRLRGNTLVLNRQSLKKPAAY